MAYCNCFYAQRASIPDGSTVTPTDVIQTLLHCAGIKDKNYTTLAQLLADTTTLSAVISSNNAIDYLVRSTTWATDMCADSTAMSYIGLNNYASNTLLADSTWRTAICQSAYKESVLNVKNPTMTSNNTPSGACSASSNGDSGTWGATIYPYYAFDNNANTEWISGNSDSSPWVQYDFGSLEEIYCMEITIHFRTFANVSTLNFITKGSTDNFASDNHTLDTYHNSEVSSSDNKNITVLRIFDSPASYRYYREQLNIAMLISGSSFVRINEIQFYGRADV